MWLSEILGVWSFDYFEKELNRSIVNEKDFEASLKRLNYKENNSWKQFYTNFVVKAFELSDEAYTTYLKSIHCPFGFITNVKNIRENYKRITIDGISEELMKTLAVIGSTSFLKTLGIPSIEVWLSTKKWFSLNEEQALSIKKIAALDNGDSYLKNKLMEMPIFKIW